MNENKHLKFNKNLLIIGGSGRNVGKTTLALSIISKVSKQTPVIGLKVSTYKQGEEKYHGSHFDFLTSGYRITAEKQMFPHKDTALMIDAGANSSFYIEVTEDKIAEAYQEFENTYNKDNYPVVCESRTLRKLIKPGLFILLVNETEIKHETNLYMKLADSTYYYNNDISGLHRLTDSIVFGSEGWKLQEI